MQKNKLYKLLLTALIWVIVYIIIKSQSFEIFKNTYITAFVYVAFIAHIWYEGWYKKNKRTQIESQHLSHLKSQINNFTPNIEPKDLPPQLVEFLPLFQKWGIANKLLREDLLENAKNHELLELKSIENKRELIEQWIESNKDHLDSTKALTLTLKSYDELGLWTWEA